MLRLILLFCLVLNVLSNRDLYLCRKFASRHFMNTCGQSPSRPARSLANMSSSKVKCYHTYACIDTLWKRPQRCTFRRKLCVSCYIRNREVKIRVQSNGLPNHCWGARKPIKQLEIDFQVNWNTLASKSGLTTMVYGQKEVNDALCTPLAHRNINLPDAVKFRNFGRYPLNLVSGVAKNGVLIFSPTGFTGEKDAFDNPHELQNLDECLGNISPKGYYFYRSISPCLYTSKIRGNRLCRGQRCNPFKQMRQHTPWDISIVGIAKDGRVILTPYKRFKKWRLPWTSRGRDLCNSSSVNVKARSLFGVKKQGRYSLTAYIASFNFPYISGCFAGGSYPSQKPTCTDHPIKEYVQLKRQLRE